MYFKEKLEITIFFLRNESKKFQSFLFSFNKIGTHFIRKYVKCLKIIKQNVYKV